MDLGLCLGVCFLGTWLKTYWRSFWRSERKKGSIHSFQRAWNVRWKSLAFLCRSNGSLLFVEWSLIIELTVVICPWWHGASIANYLFGCAFRKQVDMKNSLTSSQTLGSLYLSWTAVIFFFLFFYFIFAKESPSLFPKEVVGKSLKWKN